MPPALSTAPLGTIRAGNGVKRPPPTTPNLSPPGTFTPFRAMSWCAMAWLPEGSVQSTWRLALSTGAS